MTSYLLTIETDHIELDSKWARGMNEQLLKTSGADVLSSGKKKTQKNLLGGIHPTHPPPPTPPPLYFRGLRGMQSSKQGM